MTITHQPIMVAEVLQCLRPAPGEVAVDCTLGSGGHARAIMTRLQPGGLLIGLDVDSLELPRTEARLRADGFDANTLTTRHGSFANLPLLLAAERRPRVDVILADLGVSAMQHDTAARGFSYKHPGPLDLRLNPSAGEPASELLARLSEAQLAAVLTENADEAHAALIARLLKEQRPPVRTTHAFERVVRRGLTAALPPLSRAEVKLSIRRSFQALRIEVNGEFAALEALLRSLPQCLAPGGRVAILTFHSGEDRRVKKAFRAGRRAGVYAEVAASVVRSTKGETWANRRAASAKLRWAVRGQA
ncbi:MAG: 16S rRNA (cytosine(1402)-N(4))-methyltransferase RsmH [Acidobacteria bacterium]|nr:16S rRNA (cytosine(1402)-N(4))-methyltransferase RsmH [Acidobacteriota bacterium]